MTTRKTILFAILLLIITFCYGQSYEPIDLAKKIFGKDSLVNMENYVTGEYKGIPSGQDLSENVTTKFIILEQTEKTAVINMTILDSLGGGVDTYLFFDKDSIWKMSAFRGLAMTGLIQGMIDEFERLTPKQVDKIIAKSRKKKNNFYMFTSREDYTALSIFDR